MNHPDRIEVPGSGVKNRYRTILPSKFASTLCDCVTVGC